MKTIFALLSLCLSLYVHAADVRWNFVLANQQVSGETLLETTVREGLCFSLLFSSERSGARVRMYDVMCNAATAITFAKMAAESIVDASAFGDGKRSLYSTEYTGASGELSVAANRQFYLGFQVYEIIDDFDPMTGEGEGIIRGTPYYGWLQFRSEEDGSMVLQSSAIDLGGRGMIVGTGMTVPEPAGWVLMLVGVAGLSLRRKR